MACELFLNKAVTKKKAPLIMPWEKTSSKSLSKNKVKSWLLKFLILKSCSLKYSLHSKIQLAEI